MRLCVHLVQPDSMQLLATMCAQIALQVDMELVLQTNAQDLVQLALTQPLDLQPVLFAPLAHMAQQLDLHRAAVLIRFLALVESTHYQAPRQICGQTPIFVLAAPQEHRHHQML
jgi:hypothetical protein